MAVLTRRLEKYSESEQFPRTDELQYTTLIKPDLRDLLAYLRLRGYGWVYPGKLHSRG